MLCLKRLIFAIMFLIYLPKLASNYCFLPVELNLLSKKPEAKSKYFSKWIFLEIFGKSLLLGVLTSAFKNDIDLIGIDGQLEFMDTKLKCCYLYYKTMKCQIQL
jgi:hypothetical protein